MLCMRCLPGLVVLVLLQIILLQACGSTAAASSFAGAASTARHSGARTNIIGKHTGGRHHRRRRKLGMSDSSSSSSGGKVGGMKSNKKRHSSTPSHEEEEKSNTNDGKESAEESEESNESDNPTFGNFQLAPTDSPTNATEPAAEDVPSPPPSSIKQQVTTIPSNEPNESSNSSNAPVAIVATSPASQTSSPAAQTSSPAAPTSQTTPSTAAPSGAPTAPMPAAPSGAPTPRPILNIFAPNASSAAPVMLAPAAPATLTPVATNQPTTSVTTVCTTDSSGNYGTTTTSSTTNTTAVVAASISFMYEVETELQPGDVMLDAALERLESDIVEELLPDLFPEACSSLRVDTTTALERRKHGGQGRHRQRRQQRSLQVSSSETSNTAKNSSNGLIGISGRPLDTRVTDGTVCTTAFNDPLNTCHVVKGEITVFFQEQEQPQAKLEILTKVKQALDSGAFSDSGDFSRVSWHAVPSNILPETNDDVINSGNGTDESDDENDTISKSSEFQADDDKINQALMGSLIGLFSIVGVLVGVLLYRRCQPPLSDEDYQRETAKIHPYAGRPML